MKSIHNNYEKPKEKRKEKKDRNKEDMKERKKIGAQILSPHTSQNPMILMRQSQEHIR